jgi:hypothetical protein
VYLRRFDVWLINLIVSLFTATITEVVSNTAAANILLPILKEMSITLCANPTYLGKTFKNKYFLVSLVIDRTQPMQKPTSFDKRKLRGRFLTVQK